MLIPISQIDVNNDWNIRTQLVDLADLASSIIDDGLLNPLTVVPAGDRYRLIAGFRRFAAVKHLGWNSVECHVVEADEAQARRKNIMENLARTDLNPLEEAKGMDAICPRSSPIKYVCSTLGRSPSWVSQRRYLLTLPIDIQERFASREVSISNIYSVCKASDPKLALKTITGRTRSKRNYKAVNAQKKRTKRDIYQMTVCLLENRIGGIAPRLLAWVNGGIDTETMRAEILATAKGTA